MCASSKQPAACLYASWRTSARAYGTRTCARHAIMMVRPLVSGSRRRAVSLLSKKGTCGEFALIMNKSQFQSDVLYSISECCTWIESRHCHCSSQPSLSKPFLKQVTNEELAGMLSLEKTSNSITYLLGHKQVNSSALTECMQRQVDGRTFRAVSCAAL